MSRSKHFRAGGILLAASMLFAQFSTMPISASDVTGDDISKCNYILRYDSGLAVTRSAGAVVTLEDIGIPSSQLANASQVWIDISVDTSSGKPIMPAYGYYAPGSGEYDWYSDGVWIQNPTANMTLALDTSAEFPMVDAENLEFQVWGEEGDTVDGYTINAVGILTGDGGSIGVMTRKGDVTDDKSVNLADVIALNKYLTGESGELAAAANGDLDRNNRLNAKDLTLLKRGLLDGSLGGSSESGETAMEFVSHLKLGWNLGNTLDSWGNGYSSPTQAETQWGNPVTTKAMVTAVKNAGFNTIRIPVTWGDKANNSSYTIDSAWMNRVQEVVDYAIDQDMYVILNMHHDNDIISNGGYFYPDQAHLSNSLTFVSSIWTQIATRFEGYDSHLIFETLNEPRLVGNTYEWYLNMNDSTCVQAVDCVNQLNAAALSAIRATGGNNAKRFVMMPGYAAACSAETINGIVLPNDDHLIVSIHAYTPYDFALSLTGTSSWNESSGTGDIIANFERVKSKFLNNGIPVIVGEFGALNKNNESTRAAWAKYYVSKADSYGIPCVWWDNNYFTAATGSNSGESFGLINRSSLSVQFPSIMQAMVEASANRG